MFICMTDRTAVIVLGVVQHHWTIERLIEHIEEEEP